MAWHPSVTNCSWAEEFLPPNAFSFPVMKWKKCNQRFTETNVIVYAELLPSYTFTEQGWQIKSGIPALQSRTGHSSNYKSNCNFYYEPGLGLFPGLLPALNDPSRCFDKSLAHCGKTRRIQHLSGKLEDIYFKLLSTLYSSGIWKVTQLSPMAPAPSTAISYTRAGKLIQQVFWAHSFLHRGLDHSMHI